MKTKVKISELLIELAILSFFSMLPLLALMTFALIDAYVLYLYIDFDGVFLVTALITGFLMGHLGARVEEKRTGITKQIEV